jgi:hypothetical protein
MDHNAGLGLHESIESEMTHLGTAQTSCAMSPLVTVDLDSDVVTSVADSDGHHSFDRGGFMWYNVHLTSIQMAVDTFTF